MNIGPDDILNVRRSARYTVDRPQAVHVQIRYRCNGSVDVVTAELADISSFGMKLKTSVALPIKETVQIQLSLPEGPVDIPLDGEVCWARPKDEQHWWLGISLADAIPDGILDQLAAQEIVDRRRDRRLAVVANAQARFELGSETFDVKVLDLSQGGFSLLSPQPGHTGDRLLLIVNPNQLSVPPVLGRICWTREQGDQYVYGCEFISSTSAATVRAGLAGGSSEVDDNGGNIDDPSTLVARTTLPVLAGVACIAMLACLHLGDVTRNGQNVSFPGRGRQSLEDEPRPEARIVAVEVEPDAETAEHPLIPLLRIGFEQVQSWVE